MFLRIHALLANSASCPAVVLVVAVENLPVVVGNLPLGAVAAVDSHQAVVADNDVTWRFTSYKSPYRKCSRRGDGMCVCRGAFTYFSAPVCYAIVTYACRQAACKKDNARCVALFTFDGCRWQETYGI